MSSRGRTCFLCLCMILSLLMTEDALASKKDHVVYMGSHPHTRETTHLINHEGIINDHHEFLGSILGCKEKAKKAMIQSSTKFINAFTAKLDEDEVEKIKQHERVISVFKTRNVRAHTSNVFAYVGLETKGGTIPDGTLWKKTNYGEDMIVGVFDSGIWPESISFSDEGYGPVPSKWKGSCNTFDGVRCNRKLIGAQVFMDQHIASLDDKSMVTDAWWSPRDQMGHGTSSASCSVGNLVTNVTMGDPNEPGTRSIKGGAPRARLAIYKMGQNDAGFLLAMGAAIHDGVDLVTYECGSDGYYPYAWDGFAIGTLHAVLNGIPVVTSAGDAWDHPSLVSNNAPWMMTMGAASTDRNISADIVMGNGEHLQSFCCVTGVLEGFTPLIYAGDAKLVSVPYNNATMCLPDSLDPEKVKGKVVVCELDFNIFMNIETNVRKSGAAGVIILSANNGTMIIPQNTVLPWRQIRYAETQKLRSYLNSTKSPEAKLLPPTVTFNPNVAPAVWAYSSRGPHMKTPEIIKPDICGPAPVLVAGVPFDMDKNGKVPYAYSIASGTSVSAPATAGMTAVLKAAHPDWSPSELKSALMTTAMVIPDLEIQNNVAGSWCDYQPEVRVKATPFETGSGYVQPNKADDPGLVYKTENEEYLLYLCAIEFGPEAMFNMTGNNNFKCPPNPPKVYNMNYPSIGLDNLTDPTTVTRRVKNVGNPGSTYTAKVEQPPGISAKVSPSTLKFDKVGEEKVYTVTFAVEDRAAALAATKKQYMFFVFGSLTWNDGKHNVRSPIAVRIAGTNTVSSKQDSEL